MLALLRTRGALKTARVGGITLLETIISEKGDIAPVELCGIKLDLKRSLCPECAMRTTSLLPQASADVGNPSKLRFHVRLEKRSD